MENSWKTHGISLQQFGRHPDSGVVNSLPGTPSTPLHYGTEGFKGDPRLGPHYAII